MYENYGRCCVVGCINAVAVCGSVVWWQQELRAHCECGCKVRCTHKIGATKCTTCLLMENNSILWPRHSVCPVYIAPMYIYRQIVRKIIMQYTFFTALCKCNRAYSIRLSTKRRTHNGRGNRVLPKEQQRDIHWNFPCAMRVHCYQRIISPSAEEPSCSFEAKQRHMRHMRPTVLCVVRNV